MAERDAQAIAVVIRMHADDNVAIVGNASVAAQGVWQISTTASPDPTHAADWITIPTSGLSPTAALIFTSDRQVRFVPVAEFFGTPGLLSVRLADASSDLGAFISADATQTRGATAARNCTSSARWPVRVCRAV